MNKHIRMLSVGSVFVLSLLALMVLSPNNANAADASEYIYFRIDTELDVLNDKGVTVEWSCSGTASGSISEVGGGIASESTQLIDGIVKVSSASKEMTDSTCNFTGTKTVQGKVSIDGWVTRRWSAAITASTSLSAAFTTRASQDYNFVAGLVKDELGGALTLNGTTASVSYSGTTASSSYSGGYRYYAVTGSGTLTGGADGYVNKTVAITYNGTASQSADFDSGVASTYNGDPLPFGHKIQVFQHGGTFANSSIAYGSMVAGNSYGTTCTAGTSANNGYWFCPVPLANTETLARWSGGALQTTTGTYADRSSGSDAQTLAVINPASDVSGGGELYTATPTPTPTPDATPSPEASPTPTPSVTTPTPAPSATPVVSATAKLYRKVSDPKVYVLSNNGTLTWVKTLEEFNAAGYKWSDVVVISGPEFAKLGAKNYLGVKKGVVLNVRKAASVTAKILGKMRLNDSYEKTGESGVWLKINFNGQDGWVHSNYTVTK